MYPGGVCKQTHSRTSFGTRTCKVRQGNISQEVHQKDIIMWRSYSDRNARCRCYLSSLETHAADKQAHVRPGKFSRKVSTRVTANPSHREVGFWTGSHVMASESFMSLMQMPATSRTLRDLFGRGSPWHGPLAPLFAFPSRIRSRFQIRCLSYERRAPGKVIDPCRSFVVGGGVRWRCSAKDSWVSKQSVEDVRKFWFEIWLPMTRLT